MGFNWNFQRGGGIQTKQPSVGGVWIFSRTTHYQLIILLVVEGEGETLLCYVKCSDYLLCLLDITKLYIWSIQPYALLVVLFSV